MDYLLAALAVLAAVTVCQAQNCYKCAYSSGVKEGQSLGDFVKSSNPELEKVCQMEKVPSAMKMMCDMMSMNVLNKCMDPFDGEDGVPKCKADSCYKMTLSQGNQDVVMRDCWPAEIAGIKVKCQEMKNEGQKLVCCDGDNCNSGSHVSVSLFLGLVSFLVVILMQ